MKLSREQSDTDNGSSGEELEMEVVRQTSFYLIQQLSYNNKSSTSFYSGCCLSTVSMAVYYLSNRPVNNKNELTLGFSSCGKHLIPALLFVVTLTSS